LGIEVFENYECDGQISIFDYVEENNMDFYSLVNFDEAKGKVYCATCKHFKAHLRKQYGQILGECPYTKMNPLRACMPRCKKHYEFSGNNGVILADDFVDQCEWGTQHGLDDAGKEKIRKSIERKKNRFGGLRYFEN